MVYNEDLFRQHTTLQIVKAIDISLLLPVPTVACSFFKSYIPIGSAVVKAHPDYILVIEQEEEESLRLQWRCSVSSSSCGRISNTSSSGSTTRIISSPLKTFKFLMVQNIKFFTEAHVPGMKHTFLLFIHHSNSTSIS